MNEQEFRLNKVRFEELKECSGSMEQIEKFMAEHRHTEDEWKHRLTQSQDVVEWTKAPTTIDPLIRDSLCEFSEVVRFLAEKHKNREKPVTVLDVGCYGGYIFDYLRQEVISDPGRLVYTGMDIRLPAVEGARELHRDYANASFLEGSVFELKNMIEAGSFDIAICSRVLIHLPRFEEAVSNLLHSAASVVFIIGKVTTTGNCKLMRKYNDTTGEMMTYFYRTVSAPDIEALASAHSATSLILGNPERSYSSILFLKQYAEEIAAEAENWSPLPVCGSPKTSVWRRLRSFLQRPG